MTAETLLLGVCVIAMAPITIMVLIYQMSHRSYSNYDQTH